MACRLLIAPYGAPRTDRAIADLRAMIDARPTAMPWVWILLATRRQALRFRQTLMDDAHAGPALFNIEFFNFYSLNARLLRLAAKPVRRLEPSMRFSLLRQLLARMQAEGELHFFQRIAGTRGFVSVLADLIDELKQAGVDVKAFEAAAQNAREREIAAIYLRYQDMLIQGELADLEGEGWLALATARSNPALAADVDLLLVDGYDQFTPVQAQLLAALSASVQTARISISESPGSDGAPARSQLTRQRLERAFESAGQALHVERLAREAGGRHPDLERLGRRLLRQGPAPAPSDAIHFIAMPNPAEECKAVLRAIKRQLLNGVAPDDILVALRDWGQYAHFFEAGAKEYRLPLKLQRVDSLESAPVIAVLLDLLDLPPRFRRRDTLDVLASPYIDAGLAEDLLGALETITSESQFLGGDKRDWLELVALAGAERSEPEREASLTRLSPARQETLERCLAAFFDGVVPPAAADVRGYISWLKGLLGADPRAEGAQAERMREAAYSLRVIARASQAENENDAIARRDLEALHGLNAVFRQMLASDDVVRATFGSPPTLDWHRFKADLKAALASAGEDSSGLERQGQALVTTAAEARGLPHPHVYIPGLSEGVFPAEIPEDPLFMDSERESLQARGIELATAAERIDDQGLFYALISLPSQSLTLSRPTYQAGKIWQASHLWRSLRRTLPRQPIESRGIGELAPPPEAANDDELLLSLAEQLSQPDPAGSEDALALRRWLPTQARLMAQWRRIQARRAIELSRLSSAPFDQYSGHLSATELREYAADQLGESRVWSASQLKDYGLCGFRFFAKRLLKLEETQEPVAGYDALTLGSLNHKILEETYRLIRRRGLEIHEANLEEALRLFEEAAKPLLDEAPRLFNFRETAAWAEEKRLLFTRLANLIKQDFSPASPLKQFGERRRAIELEKRFSKVEIAMPGGLRALRLSGFIDRVDEVDGRLVVIDYKTGSASINRREMERGRDFQMLVYALAVEEQLRRDGGEKTLAGGLFWHLRSLKTSGLHQADDPEDQEAIELARAHIAGNVRQGRAGQFPVQPTALEEGKCSRFCEFARLCRMQVTSRYKRKEF